MFYFRFIILLGMFDSVFVWSTESDKEKLTEKIYKKETLIEFSDVYIEGELMKPDGVYITNRKKTKFNALIELRSNFRPELLRTLNNL